MCIDMCVHIQTNNQTNSIWEESDIHTVIWSSEEKSELILEGSLDRTAEKGEPG